MAIRTESDAFDNSRVGLKQRPSRGQALRRSLQLLVATIAAWTTLVAWTVAQATEMSAQSSYDMLAYLTQNSIDGSVDDLKGKIPKYSRNQHFGGWQLQDSSDRCSQTRVVVLLRQADPRQPVEQHPKTCRVLSGTWHEPYAGSEVTDAADLQIDHVVPLKNAYYLGGYRWRPAVRCHYANYIGNDYHLMAVSSHENMAKSDRAPDAYLPPNKAFQCTYLNNWMKIKIVWNLIATKSEVRSIETALAENNCSVYDRYITVQEYNSQRSKTQSPIASCEWFEKSSEAGQFDTMSSWDDD